MVALPAFLPRPPGQPTGDVIPICALPIHEQPALPQPPFISARLQEAIQKTTADQIDALVEEQGEAIFEKILPDHLHKLSDADAPDQRGGWYELKVGEAKRQVYKEAVKLVAEQKRERIEDGATEALKYAGLSLGAQWQDVADAAKLAVSKVTAEYKLNRPKTPEQKTDDAYKIAERFGFKSTAKATSVWTTAVTLKAMDELAWRRLLRKNLRQLREKSWILEAPLNISDCSPDALSEFLSNLAAQEKYIENHVAYGQINGTPSIIRLPTPSEAAARARAEFWARAKGLAKSGRQTGKHLYMLTLTMPPDHHPTTTAGSKGNIKQRRLNSGWNGFTPLESAQFFGKKWATFLRWTKGHKKINYRDKIDVMGVRTPEPHKDGTLHIHVLIWVDPQYAHKIRKKWIELLCTPDETTRTQDIRVSMKYVKPKSRRKNNAENPEAPDDPELTDNENSAIAYAMSYALSHAADAPADEADDGGSDDNGSEKKRKVSKKGASYQAWRQTWSFRAWSFFGEAKEGAGITVYRQFRRKTAHGYLRDDFPKIAEAADDGDWLRFQKLSGEAGLGLLYSGDTYATGHSEPEAKSSYGEPTRKIIGVATKTAEKILCMDGISRRLIIEAYKPALTYSIVRDDEANRAAAEAERPMESMVPDLSKRNQGATDEDRADDFDTENDHDFAPSSQILDANQARSGP